MNAEDYIADLEEEVRTLRHRIAGLEENLRQVKGDLEIARHRKVEEMDEGLPSEEIDHRNRPKKEEKVNPGLGTAATKREVKREVRRKKSVGDAFVPVEEDPQSTPQEPAHDTALALTRGSTAQPQREPGPTDDVVMVDFPLQPPGKRKDEGDHPSPRPAKRKTFWVEVPLRQKVLSVSVKKEPSSPRVVAEAGGATLAVKQEPDREASNALSVIRNTRLKPEKKSLDDVSVFTRLSKIGLEIFPITIEDKVKEFSVSRQGFLSKHFGGSSVQTHPKISRAKLQEHGFDKFMYIPLSLHPHAPSLPGAPGLWMCICDCYGMTENLRLLVRVQTKPALWQYMGQYENQPSDPFSTQEWAMQSDQTKREWAKYISTEPWGGAARARIKLRQLKGREPTKVEAEEFPMDECNDITQADVLEAFGKGEERLYTWSLKCRGYDERFQREIWDRAPREAAEE